MKKIALRRVIVLLVSALFILSLPLAALAHDPQRVDVYYDNNTKTLSVKITHPSNNADKHFVKEVTVKKNGAVVQQVAYMKQAGNVFTYSYILTATPADTFEVTAVCNIHGSKTVKYSPGV